LFGLVGDVLFGLLGFAVRAGGCVDFGERRTHGDGLALFR
jgi:hypothetical protein